MTINLETLSLAEMRQLLQDLPAAIKRREGAERKALVADMRALAEARGFDLDELLAVGGKPAENAERPKKPVAAKYRHPKNAALKWSGRGRKPGWVNEWLASGKALEALAVS